MKKYNKKNYNKGKQFCRGIRKASKSILFSNFTKNTILNKIAKTASDITIEKPIEKASFSLTSLFYKPKKDHPIKGAILYTFFYLLLFGLIIASFKLLLK